MLKILWFISFSNSNFFQNEQISNKILSYFLLFENPPNLSLTLKLSGTDIKSVHFVRKSSGRKSYLTSAIWTPWLGSGSLSIFNTRGSVENEVSIKSFPEIVTQPLHIIQVTSAAEPNYPKILDDFCQDNNTYNWPGDIEGLLSALEARQTRSKNPTGTRGETCSMDVAGTTGRGSRFLAAEAAFETCPSNKWR